MSEPTDTEWAWLAGFWDGEGSIGLVRNKKTKVLTVQLSHTEYETTLYILDILERAEINGRGYTYQERGPEKHRDAHYIRVSGMGNILKMAIKIRDYAVTKKRHWDIAVEWCESRIEKAGGLDSNGHLKKGGTAESRKYSDYELSLFEELKIINQRGPQDRKRRKEGRINEKYTQQ